MTTVQTSYIHQIRADDGTIFGSVVYSFNMRGPHWQTAMVKVLNAKGIIVGHDRLFARDYRPGPFCGEKCPSWLTSPSLQTLEAFAKVATPEGFTQEVQPNEVALALFTGNKHTLSRLWLPHNADGRFMLPRSPITAADISKAEGLSENEENYGQDTYKLACTNAVKRTLEEVLHMPGTSFGFRYMGRWYNPNVGNFVHVHDIGTTLESLYVRHYLSTFNKNSVSMWVFKDIEDLFKRAVNGLLEKSTFSHDEVYALRRNDALELETDEILKAVPAILPPPPGFTV